MTKAGGNNDDRNAQRGWQHFELAERAARFGYWRTTLADNKMFWSPGMYQLLGVDPDKQQPDMAWLLDAIEPEDVVNLREKIADAIKARSPFAYRTRARDAAAPAQIVDTQGEVEVSADGRVIAVAGVCTDVTAEVKAEAARETAQLHYRVMAEGASDVIVLHEDGRIVCASSALDRLLKRKPEEMRGERYLELVHPEDRAEAIKLVGRPPPGETWTASYRVRHADGHYVWFEVSTRGIYDEDTGQFCREISVGRDITERKEQELEMRAARERAEAANRAKSQFLANMSHELRTPLNAILGFTDIMRRQMLGPVGHQRYGEYANSIYDSAQLLLTHIADILEMAQIENGNLAGELEKLALKPVIEECLRPVRPRASQKGIELAIECDETLSIVADKRAVQQSLQNLLSNAIKFTPPGGHVLVRARREAGKLTLAVRDDGIGIPEAELPRLGRPFEQACADPLVAKPGTGTGLGLAIVRSLVEYHGGIMHIDSTEGLGTEVSMEFPQDSHRSAA